MAPQDRVLVDVVIAADVDTVWAALREPEQVQRWFGWDYPGLAAEIQEIFVEQAAGLYLATRAHGTGATERLARTLLDAQRPAAGREPLPPAPRRLRTEVTGAAGTPASSAE